MVSIKRLKKALGDVAWRQGVVSGPGLKHRRDPDGSHVFVVTVPAHLVEDDEPKVGVQPKSMGPAVAASPDWKPKG